MTIRILQRPGMKSLEKSHTGYIFSLHSVWWVDPASSQAQQRDGAERTKNKSEKINGYRYSLIGDVKRKINASKGNHSHP